MSMITIIGGTGMVGIPTVQQLLADGHDVTSVVRDIETARAKLPRQTHLHQGDLSNVESINGAVRKADAVVVIMPLSTEPIGAFNAEYDGTRNILTALSTNPSARIVKLSEIGAGSDPLFRDLQAKAKAEKDIEGAGHPYVILRPTWFMEAWQFQLRAGSDFLAIGKGKRKIHWVALEDMARWISTAVTSDYAVNKTLTLQGLDALSMPEAAGQLAALTGALAIPIPADAIQLPGAPESYLQTLKELFRYYDREESFEAQDAWSLLGKPKVSFDAFAKILSQKNN
jgi:uncharacterized protein YbjT (DUF2867 family)